MDMAETAKVLIAKNRDLLNESKRPDLMKAVKIIHEMTVAHKGLPQA